MGSEMCIRDSPYSGELDFRHVKQTWERVVWGKEQLLWQENLKRLLPDQPKRLALLLEKGERRGGTV